MTDDEDLWPESEMGSRKGDFDVPIGIGPDGTPVYEAPPELLAMLERMEGKCVMSIFGGCQGETKERTHGRLVMLLCDFHDASGVA